MRRRGYNSFLEINLFSLLYHFNAHAKILIFQNFSGIFRNFNFLLAKAYVFGTGDTATRKINFRHYSRIPSAKIF